MQRAGPRECCADGLLWAGAFYDETAEEAKAALIQAVEMAFEVYNGADSVTTIDLKEMGKQAQDADQ